MDEEVADEETLDAKMESLGIATQGLGLDLENANQKAKDAALLQDAHTILQKVNKANSCQQM